MKCYSYSSQILLNKRGLLGYFFLIIMIFPLPFIGCSNSFRISEDQLHHMLAIDGNGKSFELELPENNAIFENSRYVEFEQQLEAIREKLKKESNKKDSARKRILIYVHGGLSEIEASVEKSEELINLMKKTGQREDGELYYPIIVNWDSSISEAYRDHLYRVRQGKEVPRWQGVLSAPFYLFWDIGRGLIRYPITLSTQIFKGISPVPKTSNRDLEKYNEKYFSIRPQPDQILLGEDKGKRSLLNWIADSITYVVPGVLKLITTPVLDAFGRPGWYNMVRRTQTVFRTPEEFKPDVEVSDQVASFFRFDDSSLPLRYIQEESENMNNQVIATGGISRLMEELRLLKQELKESSNGKPQAHEYKITLIGFSMGTIILNQLIRYYGESTFCDPEGSDDPIDYLVCLQTQKNDVRDKDFEIDEIVYLAAACTIGDFESSVIPYMKQHPNTKFFNLTLHPKADARERVAYDVFPRGSALEWVDDFVANPASFMELTLGKWNNAIRAWHIIPKEIRNRVTLKGFGIEDPEFNGIIKSNPQKHKEFNDNKQGFWKPEYWKAPQ